MLCADGTKTRHSGGLFPRAAVAVCDKLMTIETAHAFAAAVIAPVHHNGWAHLTQSSAELEQAFAALGLRSRLQMLKPGVATSVDLAKSI
jgi:hypothetical protein